MRTPALVVVGLIALGMWEQHAFYSSFQSQGDGTAFAIFLAHEQYSGDSHRQGYEIKRLFLRDPGASKEENDRPKTINHQLRTDIFGHKVLIFRC